MHQKNQMSFRLNCPGIRAVLLLQILLLPLLLLVPLHTAQAGVATETSAAEKLERTPEQERFERLFHNNPAPMAITILPERFYIDVNEAFLKTLGYSRDEVIGKTSAELGLFVDTEEQQAVAAKLAAEGRIVDFELQLRHRDGSILTGLFSGDIIEEQENSYFLTVMVDITGRKQAEAALAARTRWFSSGLALFSIVLLTMLTRLGVIGRQRKAAAEALRLSEEKFRTLFAAMHEMVVWHELVFNEQGEAVNYRILDCNQAYSDVTGIKKETAVGKLATDVYQVETAPYLDEFSRVALTGEAYEYNTYFAPMDKHFHISVVSPVQNQFATVTTDITAIKQIQEVITAKNRELENYLYVASHDLRSPLVNIQGFSRRLQKQADSITAMLAPLNLEAESRDKLAALTGDAIPKTLHFIFTNVNKMDGLLNGLLTISRTGRAPMLSRELDAGQLFKSIIDAHSFQLHELGAVVKLETLPPCYGDAQLLDQLFSNLIGNAIKYRSPDRQLNIQISARSEGKKVTYAIRDNGLGLEPRHLEKIWDVFYRVDASLPDAGEGLGLSIARRIAEKHGGKTWAASEAGQGSVFYVELPRENFLEHNK